MATLRKTAPVLGFKSFTLALLLEAGLFWGFSHVFETPAVDAAPSRNLAWVPEDHSPSPSEEGREPPLESPRPSEPKPPSPFLRGGPLQFPMDLPPLPPLPGEGPKPQTRPLPWSPDPLDNPNITQRIPPKTVALERQAPHKLSPASPPPPSKAQSKSLSPVEGWNRKPPYPNRAIALGQEGKVELELSVDRLGRVREVRILQGSGSPLLDLVSRKTLATWRYDGGPGKVREMVIFRLDRNGIAGVELGAPQGEASPPNPRSRK